jgi:4-oxalocrotonate tautomerase
MPLAQISILEGRSEEMIAQMAEAVTEAIAKTLSTSRDKIRVVVNEVPAERWFVAGESMALRLNVGGSSPADTIASQAAAVSPSR